MSAAPEPPTPVSDTESQAQGDRPASHRVFARLMIVITGIVMLVMLGTVAIPWLTVNEPTSFIEVQGDPSNEDFELSVEGYGLTTPLYATLSKRNGYRVRFFLDEGSYVVRMKRPNQKQEIASTNIALGAKQWVLLDLANTLKPTTTSHVPASRQSPSTRTR